MIAIRALNIIIIRRIEVGRARRARDLREKRGVASKMQLHENACPRYPTTSFRARARSRPLKRTYPCGGTKLLFGCRTRDGCRSYTNVNRSRSYNNTPTTRISQATAGEAFQGIVFADIVGIQVASSSLSRPRARARQNSIFTLFDVALRQAT